MTKVDAAPAAAQGQMVADRACVTLPVGLQTFAVGGAAVFTGVPLRLPGE